MLPLILFAALQASTAPPPAAPPAMIRSGAVWSSLAVTPDGKCASLRPRFAERAGPAGLTRLDRLPPGRLELSVLRRIENCPIPAVVREGIGGAPRPEPRAPAR